ncbi:MAG: cobyric acid synthase [Spirochaetia bacterium]|nr:cobyric acid synthase [Spirochaetia bacterium]
MNRARPIMIQGTMSNAGKSLICAALCRIFRQDGYRVAPFKSQNMALNSFITEEGLEMGRAQVVQAEAAGIKPSVLMNPVLLKPTTDVGSQVIVNGEVRANMSAADYFKYKKQLIPEIMSAYERLASENDIIVIEGAGSPAEINLKEDDIVNMGLAKMVKSPVLLVGDIERGGVFAQLYGTLALLEPEERAMVKATLINKFRGDVSILKPGLDMLYKLVKVPCAGVVPYLHVDIDDEDSLSERLSNSGRKEIDIAVVLLPRISNFTDFSPFGRFSGVSLRYVKTLAELGNPDMIIIPGTKSTVSDLKWMRQNGLEAEILKAASRGTPIFGICGGLQMLGKSISDPFGTEGGGEISGMGLLDIETVFVQEKTRTQVEGSFSGIAGMFAALDGMRYRGYEIHMGQSNIHSAVLQKENVYGSYIHGLFDGAGIAKIIVEALYKKRNLTFDENAVFDPQAYREEQYDRLAESVRGALDMKLIYSIVSTGGV